MKHTAATCLLVAASLVGCQAGSKSDRGTPGVIAPDKTPDAASDSKSSRATPAANGKAGSTRAIADVEGVTVEESQLVDLLYDSNGLDALLKLMQLNMAKAVAKQRNVTVAPADVTAERKLTMAQMAPGQDEADYDGLLRQFLQQQRISRAEFEVVMETNAYLRACVRGQSNSDVTDAAIQAEFNLLYGERVRVRDIPVSNLQEVGEVQRMLALPDARFEDVARRMGKIPALAQLGGLLPEFARTSTGYSAVFIQAAFALQPGQTSTDAIQDGPYFHVIKVEDRIAPKAVKLDSVRDSVRDQLIVRRSNNLMAELRAQLAQRAVREMKINNATMQKQFEDRVAAANPKPADKREVQRSLEEQAARSTTAPSTSPTASKPVSAPNVAGTSTQPTTATTR